jgi:hypothetical protein
LIARLAYADPASDLAAAQRHFDELDYDLVLTSSEAVVNAPNATPADKAKALYLRGSALVVLDRDADTAAAFDALLEVAPDFSLPSATPPRIRAAFESTRAARRVRLEEQMATQYGAQLKDVKLTVDVPATARGGLPLQLRIRLVDPNRLVGRVVLGYRRDRDRDYSLVSTNAGADSVLTVPGAVLVSDRDYRLAWYVHAFHGSGAILRREGDEDAPRWLAIGRGQLPKPVPITRRWWFWTGAAALAASAITVSVLAVRSRDAGTQHVMVGGP